MQPPPARDPDRHPGEHPRSAQGGPWTVDHGPARPSRNLSPITYHQIEFYVRLYTKTFLHFAPMS